MVGIPFGIEIYMENGCAKKSNAFTDYVYDLSRSRVVLWCYFAWYVCIIVNNFEASVQLWATALAMSGIVGFALYLNAMDKGNERINLGRWQIARFFLIPFCVSSYSAIAKVNDFVFVFPRSLTQLIAASILCCSIVLFTAILQHTVKKRGRDD